VALIDVIPQSKRVVCVDWKYERISHFPGDPQQDSVGPERLKRSKYSEYPVSEAFLSSERLEHGKCLVILAGPLPCERKPSAARRTHFDRLDRKGSCLIDWRLRGPCVREYLRCQQGAWYDDISMKQLLIVIGIILAFAVAFGVAFVVAENMDSWDMANGPHLRAANIYQRRVCPTFDGTTFIGSAWLSHRTLNEI